MTTVPIGLGDIALHIPRPRIELSQIIERRVADDPGLDRKLRRAVESTGQKAIRFPAPWEDVVTMAAGAARSLLSRRSAASLAGLRHLAAGTESAVDHSKPLSAYVQGLLRQAGLAIPGTLSSFQVQHACAGGTMAVLAAAGMLATGGRPGESALVLCSDVARYEVPSSAEFTQGAGAVALLVEADPALVSLDLAHPGFSSNDVDDFFRPLGSTTAKVKGQYSMKCYHEAAEEAFADHCARLGRPEREVLASYDYFVFHVPFAKMAYTAARHLLSLHLGLVDGEIDSYLEPRGFFAALESTAQVGNIYTGAAYLNLASLLRDRYRAEGAGIVGKRILFSSYGSGNTMAVFGATVMPRAPGVIAAWDWSPVEDYRPADFADYQAWVDRDWSGYNQALPGFSIPKDDFYLQAIREDGYRAYAQA